MNDSDDLDFGQTIRGLAEGQKVFGRYTLRHILGRGGMGVVWLAWDETLEEQVALKFMPEMVRLDTSAIDELKRETRKSRKLTHANIVRIHDFVEDGQSAAIAMEYVDGETLSARRVKMPNRVFAVEEIIGSMQQLISALTYAHEIESVVHRDLKPANLMVNSRGQTKVADFGISSSISDSVSRMSIQVGSSGSPPYMSPQQVMGNPPQPTDDIYSLGATIYELLTGKPPFYTGNIAKQIDEVVPPSMAERREELGHQGDPIPPAWESTVAACLAKDPSERPQTVRELKERLLEASAKVPPSLTPPRCADPAVPPPAKKQTGPLVFIAVLFLLAGVVAAGWYFGFHLPAEEARLAELARVKIEKEARQAREQLEKEAEEARLAEEKRVAEEERAAAERARLIAAQRKSEEEAREAARLAALPKTLIVPDDFSRVQDAIDQARPGDTVRVKAGIYEEALVFKDGVNLIGEGMDLVTIRSSGLSKNGLYISSSKSGTVGGLTIEHSEKSSEKNRYSVLKIHNSSVEVFGCRFQNSAGHGVVISGSSTSVLRNCEVLASEWNGVYVIDKDVQAILRNNTSAANQQDGIFIGSGANGTLENNLCERNNQSGIVVENDSRATLTSNQCLNNSLSGIVIRSGASCTASANTCAKNKSNGFFVAGAGTKADLLQNRCEGNLKPGIFFDDGAGGLVQKNISERNSAGMNIRGKGSNPRLDANRFIGNSTWGLAYGQGARPQFEGDNFYSGNTKGTFLKNATWN